MMEKEDAANQHGNPQEEFSLYWQLATGGCYSYWRLWTAAYHITSSWRDTYGKVNQRQFVLARIGHAVVGSLNALVRTVIGRTARELFMAALHWRRILPASLALGGSAML